MTAAGCEMRRLFDALDILRRKLRERASLTEQLEYQALTDSLTGLLNRRALERVAAQPSDPSGPATTSLILMDIDRFTAMYRAKEDGRNCVRRADEPAHVDD